MPFVGYREPSSKIARGRLCVEQPLVYLWFLLLSCLHVLCIRYIMGVQVYSHGKSEMSIAMWPDFTQKIPAGLFTRT